MDVKCFPQSIISFNNLIIPYFILCLAKDRMLTANLVLIDGNELLVWNVECAHLVRQDGHLVRIVPLHQLPVRPYRSRNAVFNLILQVIVALAQLLLIPVLVIYLD